MSGLERCKDKKGFRGQTLMLINQRVLFLHVFCFQYRFFPSTSYKNIRNIRMLFPCLYLIFASAKPIVLHFRFDLPKIRNVFKYFELPCRKCMKEN